MKNLFRKIGFGLGPDEKIPSDPLKWALNQLDEIPPFSWQGNIPTEKELRKLYGKYIYNDRKKLRKKFKKDKQGYQKAKDKLRHETGQKYWKNLELSIRHKEAIASNVPVLTRLWYFWGNHFTISDKDHLKDYTTGAYHRETIRSNLNQTFEKMVYDATTSWAMILHLDNTDNEGPKSKSALETWRKKKNKPATINENHARELLELHTVSPNAGYTQEDIIQLAYIMTGWGYKWSKTSLETGNVWFKPKVHQPGKKTVFNKEYKSGRKGLSNVIKDLANHPSCREFIAIKLCRHFITDEPTKEMIKPIVVAWEKSGGFLPEVHKAAIKVAFEHQSKHNKFQVPENWFLQMVKMTDMDWPESEITMDAYTLGTKPSDSQRKSERVLEELGHSPYLSKQPNGWPDNQADWLSPELLIRRLILARRSWYYMKTNRKNLETYEKIVLNNFDKSETILDLLSKKDQLQDKHTLLFNSPEMLKA